MTPLTTSAGEFLAVSVPDGATDIMVMCTEELRYTEKGILFTPTKYIMLPNGKWQIVAFSDTTTEEQAAGIVDAYNPDPPSFLDIMEPLTGKYKNHLHPTCFFNSARNSLTSLLTASGVNGRCVILKKI